jgi:DNA-binding MarR family transcriptional regulator
MTRATNPPGKPRTFDSPEQQVYLELWRTYDRLRAVEDELFGRYDLTAQQYNALRLLAAARSEHPEGVPTLTLASRLISRAPDITRLVNRLLERGLVRRGQAAGDRRQVLVAITEAGLDLLKEMAGPVRDCAARQLGHLEPQQQKQLIALLQAARAPHEDEQGDW